MNLQAVRKAAEKTPSPFYFYDLDKIRQNFFDYKAALPANSQIYYAMKANFHKKILELLYGLGCGIDLVSGGELVLAKSCGFTGDKMIFSGVAKTHNEIELALKENIKQINVESMPELLRIIKVAKALGVKAPVAFRLNPDVDAKTHPYIATGFRENKFGMDMSFVPQLLTTLSENAGALEFMGLSIHIGSQLADLQPVEDAIVKILDVQNKFSLAGFIAKVLDVGGGLAVSYQMGETVPTKKQYGDLLQKLLSQFHGEIQLEPGRSIVGDAGMLVAQVEYVKITPWKKFVILNTGMHHLLRPALYSAYHEITPLYDLSSRGSELHKYEFVGPICESSDVIGTSRRMNELREGDWVIIHTAGAYGYSMASHYNLHKFPLEVTS